VLTYHHADATVCLDVVRGHEKSYDGILFCEDHANRFTAPVGWTIEDHRSQAGSDKSQVGSQASDVDRARSVEPHAD
jgi:hypothetical protein